MNTVKEYYDQVILLEEAERFEEAISLLDKIIEIEPNNIQALVDRAIDKSVLGQYPSAVEDLDKVLEFLPNTISPYVWKAEYKKEMGLYAEAMSDIEQALKLKGVVLDNGNFTGPKEFSYDAPFEEGDNLNIELEFIAFHRGAINYHLGNFEQAIKDLEFSEPIEAEYYKGITLIELGRKEEAFARLKEAIEFGDERAVAVLQKHF